MPFDHVGNFRRKLEEAGVEAALHPSDPSRIVLHPMDRITEEIRLDLRELKPEILEWLQGAESVESGGGGYETPRILENSDLSYPYPQKEIEKTEFEGLLETWSEVRSWSGELAFLWIEKVFIPHLRARLLFKESDRSIHLELPEGSRSPSGCLQALATLDLARSYIEANLSILEARGSILVERRKPDPPRRKGWNL